MRPRSSGRLRVIGGQWRSRIIEFDSDEGVRATPDRVRQTLFDWLAPIISGARCLDLFAGSGALGIEALSRGAGHCTFVDAGASQCGRIRNALATLKADGGEVVQADARRWLGREDALYNIVFIDPPYASGLGEEVLPLLLPRLNPRSHRIYLEWARGQSPQLPEGVSLIREKQAGQVCFGLATYTAAD